LAAYLDHLIQEEEHKVSAGSGNQILLGLQKTKREYDEQVKILEDAMNARGYKATITPDDIKKLEQELLSLELSGEELRKISIQATSARSNMVAYSERQLRTRISKKSDGFISDFKDAVIDGRNALLNMLQPGK